MKVLGVVAYLAAATMLVVCVGLIYLRQNSVFSMREDAKAQWDDPMLLYFGAKGVFCAVALILLYHIYAKLAARSG